MKAAVVRAFKQPLEIEDLPKPEPGAGEITHERYERMRQVLER